VIEIHERICSPQSLAQLFARDQLTGTLEQSREYLEGLLLEFEPACQLVKRAGLQVCGERPEVEDTSVATKAFHSRHPPSCCGSLAQQDRHWGVPLVPPLLDEVDCCIHFKGQSAGKSAP